MRNLIVAAACLSPLVFIASLWTAPLAGFVLMAATHAVLLYATLRPNVQWLGPVVTQFESAGKQVWLTIDDGVTADTPALLDLLDREAVKATFFVKGMLVESSPDLAQLIVRRGHTIANHSQTHPSATFWCLPPSAIARQVDRCNQALAAITGETPRWFRAPVGMKNPAVHPNLARRGMRLIGWSARGYDGIRASPRQVELRILGHLAPGAILLLHQGRPSSAAIIERVIAAVKSRGYTFVVPDDARLKTSR